MEIALSVIIAFILIALQNFLSTRKHFAFGLIIPALVVIGSVLFLVFVAKAGTQTGWIFRHLLMFGINIGIYFDGRKKVQDKKKKELEKMAIKDL